MCSVGLHCTAVLSEMYVSLQHHAIEFGHLHVAQLLLDAHVLFPEKFTAGADPNSSDWWVTQNATSPLSQLHYDFPAAFRSYQIDVRLWWPLQGFIKISAPTLPVM